MWPSLSYLAFGTLCFALALAGFARYAQDFTGFYYHPRILALTHLVTLGWITSNILGSLYLVAPIALRFTLRSGWADHVMFALYAIGVSGMVSHFWIGHDAGMAWSAGCVYIAVLFLGIKMLLVLRKSGSPGYVVFHIAASVTNLFVAAGWGLTIAINKTQGFLPTAPSANVLAHAHLAAIGWASMLVFGVAYRLLSMFVPGEPVKGYWPWISGACMETGVIVLFFTLLKQSSWSFAAAILICIGIGMFLVLAAGIFTRRKPAPPPEPRKPDFAILQAVFSFLCLAFAAVIGIFLTRLPATQSTLQLALAYGILALVGFLSQMIVAMKPRILSILAWYYDFRNHDYQPAIPRVLDRTVRIFQGFTFFLWLAGMPLIAAGILLSNRVVIVLGAVSLFCALFISTTHEITILKDIRRNHRDTETQS